MPGNNLNSAFSPIPLRGLELRNRFIKSATYEGMTKGGSPTPSLIDFHARIARGGVGLTTVAYGAVNPEARTNRHQDAYRGPIINRLRFPLEVVEAVRQAVGDEFPVCCKVNLEDGFKGGLTTGESIEMARSLQKAGFDALILSSGFTSLTPYYLMRGDVPLWEMIKAEKDSPIKVAMALFGRAIIRKYPFKENFFLPLALKIREAISMPLAYLGGVSSRKRIEQIMAAGFDMIAMARALIHDPDFILKVRDNQDFVSECNHCNIYVAEMDRGGVRCVLPVGGRQ